MLSTIRDDTWLKKNNEPTDMVKAAWLPPKKQNRTPTPKQGCVWCVKDFCCFKNGIAMWMVAG